MDNELKLKNFLKDAGLEIKSVKCGNVLGLDGYLIYANKNYSINFLYKKLNIKISKVPKLGGERGSIYIIRKDDGDKLLQGCGFNFLDALSKDNYQELIKDQLIINGTGRSETKVRFVKGKVVLLYNTLFSSTCIAKSLNICNDSVVDVSAKDCGDLKMIILLDCVGNPWVTEPIPKIKICEEKFDFNRDILCKSNTDLRFKNRMLENGMSCRNWDASWHNLIIFESDAKREDIAKLFEIPKKSVIDMYDEKNTKVILLDRVLKRVISKDSD